MLLVGVGTLSVVHLHPRVVRPKAPCVPGVLNLNAGHSESVVVNYGWPCVAYAEWSTVCDEAFARNPPPPYVSDMGDVCEPFYPEDALRDPDSQGQNAGVRCPSMFRFGHFPNHRWRPLGLAADILCSICLLAGLLLLPWGVSWLAHD